jgi:site-specific DNA recombinase
MIFERFVRLGSATVLARELAAERVLTKTGRPFDKGHIYKVLRRRVYVGEAMHKGIGYAGEHSAIISRDLWDKVHVILSKAPRTRAANTRAQTPALLKGLIFGADGRAMTPTHARKNGRLYRYYIAAGLLKGDLALGVVRRVPAGEIEAAVVDQLRGLLRAPDVIIATWRAARLQYDAFPRPRYARPC